MCQFLAMPAPMTCAAMNCPTSVEACRVGGGCANAVCLPIQNATDGSPCSTGQYVGSCQDGTCIQEGEYTAKLAGDSSIASKTALCSYYLAIALACCILCIEALCSHVDYSAVQHCNSDPGGVHACCRMCHEQARRLPCLHPPLLHHLALAACMGMPPTALSGYPCFACCEPLAVFVWLANIHSTIPACRQPCHATLWSRQHTRS